MSGVGRSVHAIFLAGIIAIASAISCASAQEVSPGGDPIHRYKNVIPDHSSPKNEAVHLADIVKKLEPLLGSYYVFHELESEGVHMDVLVFAPTPQRDRWTFVTSGMSDRAMSVPDSLDKETYGFAELVVAVPAAWFTKNEKGMIPESELEDEQKYWPIGWLKLLGRFTHTYRTWIWKGHSIPNGDPADPLAANTKLDGFVLAPLSDWPEEYRTVDAVDGARISLFAIVPVYPEEMQLKLNSGFDKLFPALLKAGVTETVHESRTNVALEAVQ